METDKEYNPTNISITGDYLKELQNLFDSNEKLLLITSPGFIKRGHVDKLKNYFSNLAIFSDIKPNPEIEHLDANFSDYKDDYKAIIALGGGSVIDSAKAFSVGLKSDYTKPLYENLIENDQQVWNEHIRLIAIPSTSGTGSEVTPFATMWDSKTQKKYSISTSFMYPDTALLDASLTLTLPKRLTLHTGLDAISHSLESLWNKNKNPKSQNYALKSLELASKSFTSLLDNLESLELRKDMQMASTYAGLAISHTRTAIAHSISYPMTLEYDIPHGLACSFTLPKILNDYLNVCPSEEKEVLLKIQGLLEKIDFKSEIESYTNGDDFKKLQNRMYTKERAGNFLMEIKESYFENF